MHPSFSTDQIRGSIYYAGIGSRETPDHVLAIMRKCAARLCQIGFILRTGGAKGADSAFEDGCLKASRQVFLPWRGFMGNSSPLYDLSNFGEAHDLASTLHPAWGRLKASEMRLHARNMYQVLGYSLSLPARFVLCYSKDGAETEAEVTRQTGGTGQAIRLASRAGIPVFNMARSCALDRLAELLRSTPSLPARSASWSWHEDGSAPSDDGGIFVFGSNLAGRHGKGAALAAKQRFGAAYGVGRGLSGNSYALPTKDESIRSLPINRIAESVLDCISLAESMTDKRFFCTRVGCELAGYRDEDIAPLFGAASGNFSFAYSWRSHLTGA